MSSRVCNQLNSKARTVVNDDYDREVARLGAPARGFAPRDRRLCAAVRCATEGRDESIQLGLAKIQKQREGEFE